MSVRSLLPLVALLAACASIAPEAKGGRCVQVVGTNDLHGHLEPSIHTVGAAQVSQGGLATLGGYLAILRARYPGQVLALDAGDMFQGTLVANLTRGEAVIAGYDALHVDAAAVGNHEFDYGPGPRSGDFQGVLKQRLREARFPLLACNLLLADGTRPDWPGLQPSTVLTVNGLKVGLVGAITPDTPHTTAASNIQGLEFPDPTACILEQVRALDARGVQVKILLAHIGGSCRRGAPVDDLSSCDPRGEIFQLLDRLPAHTFDLVVAGHTHGFVAQRYRGTAVMESGSYGNAFGWAQVCAGGETTLHGPTDVCLSTWSDGTCGSGKDRGPPTQAARFLDQPVVPDATVEQALAPFEAQVRAIRDAPAGIALPAPLTGDRHAPSALGHEVAKAMLEAAPDAQVAMINSGGLRADLPGGELRCGALYEVMPFEDQLVSLHLTGKQLRAFVSAPLAGGYGFPQLAGAKLEARGALVLDDGTPIADDGRYELVTNDFLANGGDGTAPVVATFQSGQRVDRTRWVREALGAHLRRAYPSPAAAAAGVRCDGAP